LFDRSALVPVAIRTGGDPLDGKQGPPIVGGQRSQRVMKNHARRRERPAEAAVPVGDAKIGRSA